MLPIITARTGESNGAMQLRYQCQDRSHFTTDRDEWASCKCRHVIDLWKTHSLITGFGTALSRDFCAAFMGSRQIMLQGAMEEFILAELSVSGMQDAISGTSWALSPFAPAKGRAFAERRPTMCHTKQGRRRAEL